MIKSFLLIAAAFSINASASAPLIATISSVKCRETLAPRIFNSCLVKVIQQDEILTVVLGIIVPSEKGVGYKNRIGDKIHLSNSLFYTPLEMVNRSAYRHLYQQDSNCSYLIADEL